MKAALPYLVIFGATLVLAGLTVFGLFRFRPEIFGGRSEGVDSTSTHQPVAAPTTRDSSSPPAAGTPADTLPAGSTAPAAAPANATSSSEQRGEAVFQDSIRALSAALQQERARRDSLERRPLVSQLVPLRADSTSRTDSVRTAELRTMAKVMESMEPESAAKILRDLPDKDVKAIIFRVKTRQAARILSAIEPERAARLIK